MKPRVRVVLQARMGSSRLPGKAMMPIAGIPMVVLAALRAGNQGHQVVVATSDASSDDAIADVCKARELAVVRGPLDDVLSRFVIASEDLDDADVVVRLTADNVVPDGRVVSQVVGALEDGAAFAVVGGDDAGVPYGLAAEAFTVAALRHANKAAVSAGDREHVTPSIRARYHVRRPEVVGLTGRWAGLRCTVDTPDDFGVVAGLFDGISDPVKVTYSQLCERLAAQNPIKQGRLVLGTVQLGLPYGVANDVGQPSAEAAREMLEAAASLGITHVDTSRAYGEAEERIAESGVAMGIITKVAPMEDGRYATVDESVQESLRQLACDRVDAVLLHRATDLERPGARDGLARLIEAGTTYCVGVSVQSPAELLTVLADPLFGYVQVPFNLLDRRWLADDVEQALLGRPDVLVAARSVYLQGLLAAPEARWPSIDGVDVVRLLQELDRLVHEFGRSSRADLCLAYALGQEWVDSVVVGAESTLQIRDTVELVGQTPLTTDQREQVHARVPAGPLDVVDPSRWRH